MGWDTTSGESDKLNVSPPYPSTPPGRLTSTRAARKNQRTSLSPEYLSSTSHATLRQGPSVLLEGYRHQSRP